MKERPPRSTLILTLFPYTALFRSNRSDFPVNDVIAKGELIQYVPKDGIYVYARKLADRSIVVLLNGTCQAKTLSVARYKEVIPARTVNDVVTGKQFNFNDEVIDICPRAVYIFEF